MKNAFVVRRFRCALARERMNDSANGRRPILAKSWLGETQFGCQDGRTIDDDLKFLLAESPHPFIQRTRFNAFFTQRIIGKQLFHAFEVVHKQLQDDVNPIFPDDDFGNIRRRFCTCEVYPVRSCPCGAEQDDKSQQKQGGNAD